MSVKSVTGIMLAAALLVLPLHAVPELSLPKQYLDIYLKINEAEQSERKGDLKAALDTFVVCYQQLLAIQKTDPYWQTSLVVHRLADCKAKIIDLSAKANPGAPLPVNWAPLAGVLHNIYLLKENVAASQFWIGENGDKASAWAADWVRENGGADSPDDRNGYAAGEHASRVNPFYVALPFDDLAHPQLAQKWLPKGWARAPKNGKAVSACKDRWVELKNARGDVCCAQWEDAGPKTDEAEYVFGGAGAPKAGGPGIEVSPAVGEYLGLDKLNTTVSWRFVDDADVRPGAWMKLDEQAVIYMAMHGASIK